MSHLFGDLLSQHLHRKHGLSQAKLAEGILQAPAIITDMCKGKRLTGPQARERVLQIVAWLQQQGVLNEVAEVNALLTAAGMAALQSAVGIEQALITQLSPPPQAPNLPIPAKPRHVPSATRAKAHHLPAQLPPLIGRAQDLAIIQKRVLHEGQRLLTLVGPPGVGKTRLVIQAAEELANDFADGVFFVQLATVREAALAPAMLCQALGLQESNLPPLEHLKLYLADKRILLVLDNLEQILAIAPILVELLTACPQLHLLTTSRAPLRVRAERQFPIAPLALPPLDHLPDSTTLSRYTAIALFLERSQAVLPDFALTPANATAVATLCTRLDGLPLAIELIAARVKLLSPDALLKRLDSALLLSSDGLRDSTPRQQTLREAIRWSYDLLTPLEQRLFARLGIFSGSFTLAAAEALCTDFLPERCHVEFYLQLAETAAPYLRTGEQLTWLQRLDADRANLRAALTWCASAAGDPVLGLRLANALSYYWYLRALYGEGSRWFDTLLAQAGEEAPIALRAWALSNNCLQAVGLDAIERGLALGKAAQQLAQQINDPYLLATLTLPLAQHTFCQSGRAQCNLVLNEGMRLARPLADPWLTNEFFTRLTACESDPAQRLLLRQEALAQARSIGDRAVIICLLNQIGQMAIQYSNYGEATDRLEEALRLAHQLDDKRNMYGSFVSFGSLANIQGQLEQAMAYYQEGLNTAQQTGTHGLIASAHERLGRLAQKQGKPHEALQRYQTGLRIVQPFGHRLFAAPCLLLIATLAGLPTAPLDDVQATHLYGAATAILPFEAMLLEPTDLPDIERTVTTIRSRLDEPRFAQAWAEGQAMTLDEAIAYALALDVYVEKV